MASRDGLVKQLLTLNVSVDTLVLMLVTSNVSVETSVLSVDISNVSVDTLVFILVNCVLITPSCPLNTVICALIISINV